MAKPLPSTTAKRSDAFAASSKGAAPQVFPFFADRNSRTGSLTAKNANALLFRGSRAKGAATKGSQKTAAWRKYSLPATLKR